MRASPSGRKVCNPAYASPALRILLAGLVVAVVATGAGGCGGGGSTGGPDAGLGTGGSAGRGPGTGGGGGGTAGSGSGGAGGAATGTGGTTVSGSGGRGGATGSGGVGGGAASTGGSPASSGGSAAGGGGNATGTGGSAGQSGRGGAGGSPTGSGGWAGAGGGATGSGGRPAPCSTPLSCAGAPAAPASTWCPSPSWSCVAGLCIWECLGGRTCVEAPSSGCIGCGASERSCPGRPCAFDGTGVRVESSTCTSPPPDFATWNCYGDVAYAAASLCTIQSVASGAFRWTVSCGSCIWTVTQISGGGGARTEARR